MEHHLEIAGECQRLSVAANEDPQQVEIDIDGTVHQLSFRSPGPQQLRLDIDGRAVPCWVVRIAQGLWVWVEGRARLVREVSGRRRGAGAGPVRDVTPTMPAVVTAVLVEPWELVEQGQALVVLTAMKMETTLVAPYAGTVSAVNTAVDAKVSPGEILVEIAPEASEEVPDE